MHVADLHPLLPAEVGHLCILAIWAPDFDNTTGFAWLHGIMTLLGDVSISLEPESAMNLYIMSIAMIIDAERLTKVVLRTSAAWGKSRPLTKPSTLTAPSKSIQHC